MTVYLLGLLLAGFCFYPSMDGRVFYEALWGLSFLSLVYCYEFGRKIHWSLGLNLFILLLSGLYVFFFPSSYPIPVNPVIVARASGDIVYAMVTLLLFSNLLMTKDKSFFNKVLRLLFCAAFADSLAMIYGHFILHEPLPYAMLSNGTADACFIACMLPMIFQIEDRFKYLFLFVMTGAIGLTHSNTAFASIGVGIAFYLLQKMNFKNWVMIMFPVTAAFLLVAKFVVGDHFLLDSGRRFVWEGSFAFYKQFANLWIGIGTGTFTQWGIAWQAAHNIESKGVELWFWLHSEPLEILFENGIIGLASALIAYGYLLYKSFKTYIFPIACVYGFTCLTEMPLRLFPTQVLGIALLGIAFGGHQTRDIVHAKSIKAP